MSTSELGTVSTQTSSTTSQTNIDISERPAPSLGNAAAFTVLLGSLAACLGSGYWLFLAIKQQVHAQGTSTAATVSIVAASLLIALFVALPASTLTLVNPGHTKVVQFFGRYIGSLRRTGLSLLPPFANRRVVSARVQNFETHELKVNDLDGNPINIAAIVVWQVRDTARAAFAVEDYIDFVETPGRISPAARGFFSSLRSGRSWRNFPARFHRHGGHRASPRSIEPGDHSRHRNH